MGCGRSITCGIAHVVVDEHGNTGFAGSHCVKKSVNYRAVAGVPDFTSACTEITGLTGSGRGAAGMGNNNHPVAEDKIKVAITYLLLRFERLGFYRLLQKNNKGNLTNVYARYQANPQLSDMDVNYLYACATTAGAYKQFNLKNLMAFYNLLHLCNEIGGNKNATRQDKKDASRVSSDLFRNFSVPDVDVNLINSILVRAGYNLKFKANAFQL